MSTRTLILLAAALLVPLVYWLQRDPSGSASTPAAPTPPAAPTGDEAAAPTRGGRAPIAAAGATAAPPVAPVEDMTPASPAGSATVTGTVYGPDGAPAGAREVSFISRTAGRTQRVTSDPSGAFEAVDLEPGHWALVSFPTEEELARLEIDGDPFLLAVQARVDLDAGEVAHVELGAPPDSPVVVSGVVRLADGTPTPAFLQWMPEGADPAAGQAFPQAGKDGRYEVSLAAPGRWRVGVTARRHRAELHVTVPDAPTFEHDLVLPGGALGVQVVDDIGAPVGGVSLTIHVEAGVARLAPTLRAVRTVRTDEDGRARFESLPPATYGLACAGRPAAEGAAALAAAFTGGHVVGDGPVEAPRLVLPPGASLTGTVVDATGAPFRGAAIFVRDGEGAALNPTSFCRTDEEGRYETPPLATGVVSLQAWGGDVASAPTPTFVAGPGRPEGELPTDLVLAPAAVVRVAFDDLDPATVLLSARDAAGLEHGGLLDPRRPWDWLQGGHRVDVERLAPLPPGRYDLEARDASGAVRTARVTVGPLDDVVVQLER